MKQVTFTNFEVGTDDVNDVGAYYDYDGLGALPDRPGVIPEIKSAFGYNGSNLEELIGVVAPHKALQENIAFAQETLSKPEVRQRIGYEAYEPARVAHEWGTRSDLQAKVFRPLLRPAHEGETEGLEFDAMVITDGVVRWMLRTAEIAAEISKQYKVGRLVLGASDRKIGESEHPDVKGGTSVFSFMTGELVRRLEEADLRLTSDTVEIVPPGEQWGEGVMRKVVSWLSTEEDFGETRVIIPAVAGNWPQKGAQLRDAYQELAPGADTIETPKIWVASDSFPLGVTGEEPKTTHQNQFSGIGNILRGAMYLDRQAPSTS